MHWIPAVALFLLIGLQAQNRAPKPLNATSGFGNILYPGTGAPPAAKPFAAPIFPQRTTSRNVFPVVSQRPKVIFLPAYFGVPYFIFPAGEPVMAPAPAPPPIAFTNPNYVPETAKPVVTEYTGTTNQQGAQPEPEHKSVLTIIGEEKPAVYLIALKNSTVYSALAYWLEEDALHYITTQHSHNRVSLDLVDAGLSQQLNQERGVAFKLP